MNMACATTPPDCRPSRSPFLDRIIIPTGDGQLRVVGNLGEMLTAATGWDGTALAAVVLLVAGAGFEPATFGL